MGKLSLKLQTQPSEDRLGLSLPLPRCSPAPRHGGWRGAGRGEPLLPCSRLGRTGVVISAGKGRAQRRRHRPTSIAVCRAPTRVRPRVVVSSSAWRLALSTVRETAASIQLHTQLHTDTPRTEIPSPTKHPQADYTHGIQIHQHGQSHTITYAQRCCKHKQTHLTVIHRLTAMTKPRRKHHNRLPIPLFFQHAPPRSLHPHVPAASISYTETSNLSEETFFIFIFQRKKAI